MAAEISIKLADEGREVSHGRLGRQKTKLSTYTVHGVTGAVIGIVAIEMATFERKPSGKRYVNNRWHSPRWFYYLSGSAFRRGTYETRAAAVAALLADDARRNERAPA